MMVDSIAAQVNRRAEEAVRIDMNSGPAAHRPMGQEMNAVTAKPF
jgi:hypothetical protein